MTQTLKLILFSVSLGAFIAGLNTSMISPVLAEIQRDLQLPLTTIQWIISIYPLMVCAFVLPMGRLGDFIGHKKIYISGLLLTCIFSIACGLTQSMTILIICRAFQALGGAMTMAAIPVILTTAFPDSQRGKALGFWASTVYVGIFIGPILGGWLTTWMDWSAIFYSTVPITLLALYIGFRFIPELEKKPRVHFDIAGGFLFLITLTLLLLSLNQGPVSGWSALWVSVLCLSALFALLFIWVESKTSVPMLQLSLLKNHVISFGILSSVSNYIVMFFYYTMLPLHLVRTMGIPLYQAGTYLAIAPLFMLLASMFSGKLSDHIGTRIPSTIGMGLLTVGIVILPISNGFPSGITIYTVIVSGMLIGTGSGLFTTPNNSAVFGATPPSMRGTASGLSGTARYLGQALGLTLSTMLFELFQSWTVSVHTAPDMFAFQQTMYIGAGIGILGTLFSFVSVPKKERATAVLQTKHAQHP